MKRIIVFFCLLAGSYQANAQAEELAQLALNIEKLAQFKQILSDLEKAYEIVFTGYTKIKNIAEGNFNLHDAFLDGLLQVSPAVKKYHRIAGIIELQLALVKEYKSAYDRFKNHGQFTGKELEYMGKVYTRLLQQSLQNLDALAEVITANKLRMSDDERLSAIDKIYERMSGKLNFLRQFNNSTSVLGVQRSKEQQDINRMRQLYKAKDK